MNINKHRGGEKINKLYRLIPTVWLNGKELYSGGTIYLQLYYGEVPSQGLMVEYTNFDEAWNQGLLFCSKDKTYFRGKRIIKGKKVGGFKTFCVQEETFESYKVRFGVKIYDDNSFSTHDLMERLSATDFAKWCKDNSLQFCPLK